MAAQCESETRNVGIHAHHAVVQVSLEASRPPASTMWCIGAAPALLLLTSFVAAPRWQVSGDGSVCQTWIHL